MKNAKSNNNGTNNNKGVSMKKSKLVISDLALEMSNLYYTSSFGVVSSKEHYATEEWSIDTEEYLMSQSNPESEEDQKKLSNYKKAVAKVLNVKADDEVMELTCAQKLDLMKAPNSSLKSDNRYVYVTVQRKNKDGRWYNAKKYGNKITIKFLVEALFDLNEDDNITNLKVNDKGETCLDSDMKKYGFLSYFITHDGEFQDQRFLMSSILFTDGLELEGQQIISTVAPFNYIYEDINWILANSYFNESAVKFSNVLSHKALKKMDVWLWRTSHAYDSIIELTDTIALVPSDVDMSNGDAADKLFNEGIITGSGVSTQSMMSDDMQKQDLKEKRNEERNLKSISIKTKIKEEYKKEAIKANYAEILNSDMGFFAEMLINDSYSTDKETLKSVYERLEAEENKEELKSAIVAHRVVNGRGLKYSVFMDFLKMIDKSVKQEIATNVDKSVVLNISNLNNGKVKLEQLGDNDVVAMYEAALVYRRKNNLFNIEKELSKAVKTRYSQIKGIKVS